MTMHLQKLSVGSEGIDTLAEWQRLVVRRRKAKGKTAVHEHVTRMFPKQKEALLNGGSIFWVIKGQIQCRNKIISLEEVRGADGIRRCAILMEPGPVPVIPVPRRPFQGWRYLKPEDAPADLTESLAPGERSASQISQLGRSSSIIALNRTIIDEPHGFAVLSIAWAMCCNE